MKIIFLFVIAIACFQLSHKQNIPTVDNKNAGVDFSFVQNESDTCPEIHILCEEGKCCGKKRAFYATMTLLHKDRRPEFKWTTTAGKIVGKDNEWYVEVDATDVEKPFLVNVEVIDYFPTVCQNKDSFKSDCSDCQK